MQRYIWKYIAVALFLVLSVTYLDLQVDYRASPVETWKRQWTPLTEWDWWRNADDQWSGDESVPELSETDDSWDSIKNGSKRRLPGVLIFGAKRAGTRALLEMLLLHPDVVGPHFEQHFFNKQYEKGLHWYRMQMPLSKEGQLTIEKTPTYLMNPKTPKRVASMSTSVRLLLVVRDPVTRAVSDYMETFKNTPQETRSFEDMAFRNASIGLLDTDWSVIRAGQYSEHLERWLRFFPLKQIFVVSGERLIEDPAQELQGVQEFLDLRPIIGAHHFVFNQSKGFLCMRKSPGTDPICLGKSKGRKHPSVAPSALQILRDFYRPFNKKFYRIVDRDFGWS